MEGDRVPATDVFSELKDFTAEFLISQEKAVRGGFKVMNEESAKLTALALAIQGFPHIQGFTVWGGIGEDVLKTPPLVHVPLSQAWAFFGPKINQATKAMAIPVAKVVSPDLFERQVAEARAKKESP